MEQRLKAGFLIGVIFLSLIFIFEIFSVSFSKFKNSMTDSEIISTPPIQPTNLAPVLPTLAPSFEKVQVKKVVDGDTIHLTDGRVVRYIGIDTPETVHPQKSAQCFGKEASAQNKFLVEGKEIWLEKDVSEVDRYQRLLRYVYLVDPANLASESAKTQMVNAELVAGGFAYASSYPPDVKYQEIFRELEGQSRINYQGLWGITDCARTN